MISLTRRERRLACFVISRFPSMWIPEAPHVYAGTLSFTFSLIVSFDCSIRL